MKLKKIGLYAALIILLGTAAVAKMEGWGFAEAPLNSGAELVKGEIQELNAEEAAAAAQVSPTTAE